MAEYFFERHKKPQIRLCHVKMRAIRSNKSLRKLYP